MSAVGGEPLDMDAWWALTRWQMAMDTGLSLRTIDRLPLKDISDYLSVKDALAKIKKQLAKREAR